MIDYNEIAKKHAEKNHCDIVCPSVESKGYRYFRLDFTGRPRYTGHPHIIKINSAGVVTEVLNFDEIYWAAKQAKEPLK